MSVPSGYHPHPWRVFTATSIGVVAVFVSMSGLTVALPTLVAELDASPAQATWILLGYMLVTTALILVFGRLADIVGRRPLYLGGLAIFTLATLLCLLSPSPEWLIAARVIQGIGAAAVITNNTALLTDVFASRDLGRVLGWNATVAAVSQVAGPVIGGAATALVGWRGLFVAVFGIAVLATITSLMVIPRQTASPQRREGFDGSGAALSTVALTFAVLALTPGLTRLGWLPWAFGGAALVLGTLFVAVQMRRREPLIDTALFANRGVTLVLAAALLNAVATFAVALMISVYAQTVDGVTPIAAGLYVTPIAVGTVIAAVAAGSAVNHLTPRALCVTGMALTCLGVFTTTVTLSPEAFSLPHTATFLFVTGCGIGLFMTPSTSALMLTVPATRRGIANGMRSTLQHTGNLVSTALVLALAPVGVGTFGGPGNAARLVEGLRTAGLALSAVALFGIVFCMGFPRGPARRGPRDATGAVPITTAAKESP